MFQKKRLLAGALALATCVNLVTVGAFAGNERSTSTQTSSAEETVYVNSYGGTSRQVDFSNHWRFNLGSGSEAVDYNDSAWRDVDLPHDYSIEQEYTQSGEAESGYLPGGTGWYRKTFTLDQSWQDKVITVDFGGVYMNATVYLNGQKLGFHPYGYTAFSFELPQNLLKYDGENVLAVKVEHETPSSRWYSGSGIYRTVHLTVTEPVHVANNGTFVTTPDLATNQSTPKVNIVTTVANDGDQEATVSVKQTIYKNGSDAEVATIEGQSVTVAAGETQNVTQETTVASPALWSTDHPNLYTVKTEIVKGEQVVDTYTTEFGFRWTEFNNTTGFELNGVPTKLKGVCMHHDQGALGAEAWYRAMERQVEILKDMGCNAIRVTHNPAAPELIEIANRHGMMIVDEAFDMWVMSKNGNYNDYSKWFEKTIGADNAILGGEADMTWAEFDIKAVAYQDRNSPAVIMYSLGNEIFEGTANNRASEYPGIAENLCTWLQEVDNTRPPTFGQNSNNDTWAFKVAEVIHKFGGVSGVNYANTGRFDQWINKGWKVYYAETASAVNSRGVYDRKASNGDGGKGDYLLTSYDKSAVGWGATASDAWKRVLDRDNSMGEFVWTGFDYIGEPTPWNGTGTGKPGNASTWPAPKSSYFGIIDTNGLPKDSYYLYQSLWNDDVTTLHVLPTWNQDDLVLNSGNVEVVVYSDAPVVKLLLNGEVVGVAETTEVVTDAGYTYRTFSAGDMPSGKTNTFTAKSGHESLYATFWVPYEEGTLEVKAYQADGTTPITDTEGRNVVKTTSAPTKLTAQADRPEIVANGDDLSYITIDVKDANGNLVNTDDVNVQLSIEGNGKIVGVDNGRQPDHTSYQSLSRNVAAGQLVAIVQSTDKAGSFTVTATADGLTAGSVTVNTTLVAGGSDNSIVSYDISRYHYVKVGNEPQLPQTVVANYKDGSTKELAVTWKDYDHSLIEKVGSFAISGTLEEGNITVTVNITMLDQVTALLNYSAAVRKGGDVTLPSSRPAVLADGTILNAEFPVDWDIPADLTATTGVKKVEGTSQVFGEDIAVTASVRVAEGDVTIGNNVAAQASELTQDIPEDLQSDTLEAIRDGKTVVDPNNDGGANESTWSNYNSAQEGNKTASLTFRYDTAQFLGEVVMYYATDSFSAALPSDVKMEVSGNGVEWTTLKTTAGEATNPHDNVTRIAYTFEPQDAVFFRVTVTNKEGDPTSAATSYCVSLTEVELNVARTSFPINNSDALTGITFNGKDWSASELSARTYSTEALVVDSLDIESGNNAAHTVLPAHNNVVKILTESEDHAKRGTYTINLGSTPSAGDPADGSRDYDYTKTTATAPSQQTPASGGEGPVEFAVDNKRDTFWHSNWNEDLSGKPESRYIQLKLAEVTTLDALRYLPRPTIANGIVTKYRVEVSMDGNDWTTVSEGDWAHDSTWKIALFEQPVQAQYVRLYGVETRGGANDTPNKFMSAAEVRVRMAEQKTDLSDAVVTLDKTSFDYTGQAIEPEVTSVMLGDQELTYGLDYKVEYTNNTAPGTGTVTVRGIVDYTGAKSVTFTINAVNLDVDTVETVSVVTPQNEQPKLPTTVKVTFTDGTSLNCPVVWDTVDTDELATVGNVFTVNGTVTLPGEGKTTQATATVRVSTGNLALAQEGSTLPLAVSFYAPENDSAANINDGSKTFDVSADKKVWSDWERGVFHEAPWVSIVLKEATTVDRVSIGFIDEAASDDPNVAQGNKVRLPASYEIQVYTGTDELDYKTDNVNNGKNWPVMNNDANWTTVATVTKLPTSANYAQMLDTTFTAVETTAVRVVMTPQNEQWVGVDELEIYGPGEKVLSSDFEVTSITADGKDILSKADDKNHITLTVKEGDPMPALAATASNNAKVTITPAADFNGQATIVITSEDGSKTVTYTVSFQVKTEPEPTPTVAPTAQPTVAPTAQPTDKPEPTAQPTDKPEPSTEPTQQPGTTEQPVVTQQPGATDKPQATQQPQDGPAETGDTANLIPVVAVLVTAAAALMAVVLVARKRRG